jgi:hypothetical protein
MRQTLAGLPRIRQRLPWLLAAVAMCCAGQCSATSYGRIAPPLSDEEMFQRLVVTSDAIAIGRLIWSENYVSSSGIPLRNRFLDSERIARWLKGPLRVDSLRMILPRDDAVRWEDFRGTTIDTVLIFLRNRPPVPEPLSELAIAMGAKASPGGWALHSSPVEGPGVQPIFNGESNLMAARVERILRAMSLDSLAKRAEAIAIGRRREAVYGSFSVESIWFGSLPDSVIQVVPRALWDITTDSALLILTPRGDGRYVPVEAAAGAGIIPIRGDTLARYEIPLARAKEIIQQAVAQGPATLPRPRK